MHVTCVELLGLPVGPQIVGNAILDVIVKGYTIISQNQIHDWVNCIGLIMAALPETYWSVIYDRLQSILTSNEFIDWQYRCSPFDMFNFKTVKEAMLEKTNVLTLALIHSILHHFGIGQITTIAELSLISFFEF